VTQLSIIIPTCNHADELIHCLHQLHEQPFGIDHEIIVVDQCESLAVQQKVKQAVASEVAYLYVPEHLDAEARNVGIRQAKGRYILLLSDDAFPLVKAVENALQIMEKPGAAQVGCIALRSCYPDGNVDAPGLPTAFNHSGALFRKQALIEAGLYATDYVQFVEEYDLAFRLIALGYTILHFRELMVMHQHKDEQKDFDVQLRQMVANQFVLWHKFFPFEQAQYHLQTQLWRYNHIAKETEAEPAFELGVEMGQQQIKRWQDRRKFELDALTADHALGIAFLEDSIMHLQKAQPSACNIFIISAGKLIHVLIDMLRENGYNILGIIEDYESMFDDTFKDVPVFPFEKLSTTQWDAAICGSSNLVLNELYSLAMTEWFPKQYFQPIATYHSLAEWLHG
jgi:GT2 family glycosyltransferase